MGPLREHLSTFMYLAQFFLRIRNVSDKICRINQNIFYFSNVFFFENRAVYEIIWKKNMVQPDRLQMTIQYVACALRAA